MHYGPQKIAFRPFMNLEAEGIGVDIVMKGLTFFNVQFGISNISLETRGNCICGADDSEELRVSIFQGSEVCLFMVGKTYSNFRKKAPHIKSLYLLWSVYIIDFM